MTQYTVAPPRNRNKDKEVSHSIYSRFQKEFRKTFTSNLNSQLESMSKVLYTINPKKYPQFKLKKELIRKQTLELNPNQANIGDSFSENLSHIKLNESEETEETHPPTLITFTELSQIDYDKKRKHRRVRNFKKYTNEDYIKHSKWKVKEGIERQEGKIHIILQKDLRFQYDYIKDELKVLIESIQYLKSNLLSSNDILSAFKNKDLCYQTSTNIIIEETCALLEEISKYILCDYCEYSERFISIEGASIDDFLTKTVTNETEIFIVNIKLLVKISNFLKCVFEVYMMLIAQVDDIIIKPSKFCILRMIMEKCRFNISEILMRGKTSIHDLNFDRNLIMKYQPILSKEVITARDIEVAQYGRQQGLDDHLRSQVNFAKNEFTQKKLRLVNVLHDDKEDKPLKKRKELKIGNLTGFSGPMALIKSELMTKMLKYCKKEHREKIISLRTIERYQKEATKSE